MIIVDEALDVPSTTRTHTSQSLHRPTNQKKVRSITLRLQAASGAKLPASTGEGDGPSLYSGLGDITSALGTM